MTEARTRTSAERSFGDRVAFWLALSLWASSVALAAFGVLFAFPNGFATVYSP